jgi:hypothetical protein
VDVGFPIAAARTPASLAGGPGEWVIGVEDGLVIGSGTLGAVADVAGLDPRVDAIVAETIVPTLVGGEAVVLRGAGWDALAAYHGLQMLSGRPPSGDELALGRRAAERAGWELGDRVTVQAAARPEVRTLSVVGIVKADGPEADEGFVDTDTGRALASLPPGYANVIRFRPETREAQAAVLQEAANLVVSGVAVQPADPPAGSLASAVVEVANLGAQEGSRIVYVRLNGDLLATAGVTVEAHKRELVTVMFVVPLGPLLIEVNPSTSGTATASPLQWAQEADGGVGDSATFQLTRDSGEAAAGVAAALYPDLAAASEDQSRIAEGLTDGEGRIRFGVDGPFVIGTVDEPRIFLEGAPLLVAAEVVVTDVWTVPSPVAVGQLATLYGRVHNPGSARAQGDVPGFIGPLEVGKASYDLAPGEAQTVSFPLYFGSQVSSVGVGNRTLALVAAPQDSEPAPPDPAAPPPERAPPPRSGAGIQSQVASRVLGDARQALVGLGGCALLSTLAVVYLATQRMLAGRRHVAGLLEALGQSQDAIRSRAAIEGAVLGALCLAVLLLPIKIAFWAMAEWGPAVFAHALPDPVGFLFAVQATAAFGAACAWAAYLAASRTADAA